VPRIEATQLPVFPGSCKWTIILDF
jgi:hypothetical protein